MVVGLLAGSAAAFAYSKEQPPATTWPTKIEQDVVAASPAAGDAAAARPAAARDRQRGPSAVQPVQFRRRGDGAAQAQRLSPHRVPAPW